MKLVNVEYKLQYLDRKQIVTDLIVEINNMKKKSIIIDNKIVMRVSNVNFTVFINDSTVSVNFFFLFSIMILLSLDLKNLKSLKKSFFHNIHEKD